MVRDCHSAQRETLVSSVMRNPENNKKEILMNFYWIPHHGVALLRLCGMTILAPCNNAPCKGRGER